MAEAEKQGNVFSMHLQDIDTIYLSNGTQEMNLGDFDHLLDGR